MIRGLFLETEPNMSKVSESDILSNLDFLKIAEESVSVNIDDCKVERTGYYSDKYYITVYQFTGNDMECFNKICKPYEILQKAWPELLKEFTYQDNKLIYAIPRYNTGEDLTYKNLVDELIRFISFFYFTIRSTGKDDEAMTEMMTIEYIKEYIEFAVSTPNKRK